MLTRKFKITVGSILAVSGLAGLGLVESSQQAQINQIRQEVKVPVIVIQPTPSASPSAALTVTPTKYLKYSPTQPARGIGK